MSMAHFDDLNDICCELMEEEKVLVKAKTPVESPSPVAMETHVDTRWWEDVLEEIESECENEYELYPV
jgi:hypothetical protein